MFLTYTTEAIVRYQYSQSHILESRCAYLGELVATRLTVGIRPRARPGMHGLILHRDRAAALQRYDLANDNYLASRDLRCKVYTQLAARVSM